MSKATIIWCHGSLSQPWGTKSETLADVAKAARVPMEALDFQDLDNPDERVERLALKLAELDGPVILAGSSMGGYVATAVAKYTEVAGLFLLAPALYLPGYDLHVFSNLPKAVSVVHGWNDDVVPVENSIRFAKQHMADLHILPDEHRLSESVEAIGFLFQDFLDTVKKG